MTYRYITAAQLSALIKSTSPTSSAPSFAIIDVRDSDYVGGNIVGARRAPSEGFSQDKAGQLVQEMKALGVEKVIFHCALSQERGPKAARRFAAALAQHSPAVVLASSNERELPNPYESDRGVKPEVLVLRDGFQGFQSLYRTDSELVENFDVRVWGDYAA